MSHYQGDDGEYVADDYEAEDVDVDEEFHGRELADPESDVDELDMSVSNPFCYHYNCIQGSFYYNMCFKHFDLFFSSALT